MVTLQLAAVLTAASEKVLPFLEKVGKYAATNLFTFENMSKTMNNAFGQVKKFGIAAVAALAGIGFTSPSAQAAFARMKKPLFDISETLGKALTPGLIIFGDLLKDVGQWLNENTWFTEGLSKAFETLATIAGSVWDKMTKLANLVVKPVLEWAADIKLGEKLQWLFDHFGFTILGALFGAQFGLPGLAIGAGAGLIADLLTWPTSPATPEQIEAGMAQQWGSGTMMGGQQPINIVINGETISSDKIEVTTGALGTPWG